MSGATDNSIKIWNLVADRNLDAVQEVKSLEGHKKIVTCVALSDDCLYVISGSWDKHIKVWNF